MPQPFRIGIVGCGFIAGVIARAIAESETSLLSAVASRRRETAEAFAAGHGHPRVFDTWEELVASDAIDGVYVATPTHVRETVAVAAAQHGKHVLGDKPFFNLASLRRITAACREAGVAFLDATHFSHHPRTTQIKQELTRRIGPIEAVQSTFFFPNADRNNIRFDASKEPTGAIGDMAWYSMRAAAEYLPEKAEPVQVSAVGTRDPVTQTLVRSAGCILFSDGTTTTWDAGFTVGSLIMDLSLFGRTGSIHMDDFVLDWAGGMAGANPAHPVGFTQRNGPAMPGQFESVPTPSPKRQAVRMIEHWARLASDPHGDAMRESIRISERTQSLVDAVAAATRTLA